MSLWDWVNPLAWTGSGEKPGWDALDEDIKRKIEAHIAKNKEEFEKIGTEFERVQAENEKLRRAAKRPSPYELPSLLQAEMGFPTAPPPAILYGLSPGVQRLYVDGILKDGDLRKLERAYKRPRSKSPAPRAKKPRSKSPAPRAKKPRSKSPAARRR